MGKLDDLKTYVSNRFVDSAQAPIDTFLTEPDTVKFLNDKRMVVKVPNRGGFKLFMMVAEIGTNSGATAWNKKVDALLAHFKSKYKVKFAADKVSVIRNGVVSNFAAIAFNADQASQGMQSSLHLPLVGD